MAIRRTTGRPSVLSTTGWLFLLNLSLCAAIFGGTPAAIFGNLLGSKEKENNNERSQQQQQQRGRQQQNQYPEQQRRLPPPPPPSGRGQSNAQSQLPPPPPPGTSWNRPPPPPPLRQDPVQEQQRIEPSSSSTSPAGTGNVTKPSASWGAPSLGARPPPPRPIHQQGQQHQQEDQQQQQQPQFYAQQQHGNLPPPSPGWRPNEEQWIPPPQPQGFQDWQPEYREDDGVAHWDQMDQSGMNNNGMDMDNRILQQELQLDESMQREQALLQTVQNMTTSVATMEQREELHVRQLDVLTERVMDVEAAAAQDKNAVKEYQVNCTALGQQVALLEGQVEEWKSSCADFSDQHDMDEQKIADLTLSSKQASVQAEDLAGMIERHRLEQGLELYSKKKHKKSRGFFGWLFGSSSNDDDGWDEMHEAARSTLLRALQTERNNVEELESAVTSLQQNNSAISEQVQSRDLIIDELNDRVAVFEEDKLVLRAALRQLQKEMNDEAPRTQKLVDNLTSAQKEVKRLRQEIESLISTHQDEIGSLQHAISSKQSTIQQKESNLTVIGTYVDKLEERLADFAVARRDIEVRERKCQELETAVVDAERERDAMRTRVESFEKEHDELRELLEEIVRERTKLRKEISQLEVQRARLEQEGKQMQDSVGTRDNEIQRLKENDAQWQVQTQQLNSELEQMQTYNEQIQVALRDAESSTTELRNDVEATLQARGELQGVLDQTEAAKNELQFKLSSLEEAEAAKLDALEKAEAAQRELQIKLSSLEEAEAAKIELQIKLASLEAASLEKAKEAASLEKAKEAASLENAKAAVPVANAPPPPPPRATMSATARTLASTEGLLPNATEKLPVNESVRAPSTATAKAAPEPIIPVQKGNATTLYNFTANSTKQSIPDPKEAAATKKGSDKGKKVPLRKVRKLFSKATGIHGIFSRKRQTSSSVSATTITNSKPKAPAPISARQRPDVLSHTPSGLKTATPSPFQKSAVPKPFQKNEKP
jgi:chromosome segregation ATPase